MGGKKLFVNAYKRIILAQFSIDHLHKICTHCTHTISVGLSLLTLEKISVVCGAFDTQEISFLRKRVFLWCTNP